MSLGTWGLYGDLWIDVSSPTPPRQFRPRRPSYVLATQTTRTRADSCYSAAEIVASESGEFGPSGVPAIAFYTHDDLDNDDLVALGRGGDGSLRLFSSPEPTPSDAGQWKRSSAVGADSRRSSRATVRSTLDTNHVTVAAGSRPLSVASSPPGWTTLFVDHPRSANSDTNLNKLTLTEFTGGTDLEGPGGGPNVDDDVEDAAAAIAEKLSADTATAWRRRKNFLALSIGFLLIYTAFRSIQALQSSINAAGRLGVIAMSCVHGSMAAVCPLLAPTVAAGRPPPKWTVVLAAVLYVGWMTANLWPHPLHNHVIAAPGSRFPSLSRRVTSEIVACGHIRLRCFQCRWWPAWRSASAGRRRSPS